LEMIKLAPDNALAYANLGVAEHQLGNLLAASGKWGKSLELNPHIARNWQTMGLISYERRELALAISCLTRAIHEDPEDPESRLLLAAVIRDYGWKEAAVTELQRAIELDPGQASAHYNLAVTYLEMKPPRMELARRHYYAAVDLGTTPSPEIEALFKDAE
ncbi:MAG: tetratricopeptide repeat protein, partial [Verrucomicrobiales bacterium]